MTIPVIDLHCDTVLALLEQEQAGQRPSLKTNPLHVDLEKLQQGHYLLQCFALFTDRARLPVPEQQAFRLYELYQRLLQENERWIAPVYSFEDIETNARQHKLSALITLEEGGVCFGDLSMLRVWYQLGVRMITLTWNYPNGIGYPNISFGGSQNWNEPAFTHRVDDKNGLSEFGIRYVQEMERLGMIIDVSHLSDAGFWDVVKYTSKPFAASHSNARTICPVGRNLSDEMILALAHRGGIMGMNFCADFLNEEAGVCRIQDILRHIRHIRDLAGIDCIALGSDFDGITNPVEMKNAAGMQQLARAMAKEGFSQEEIRKVFYLNALRFFRQVLRCK